MVVVVMQLQVEDAEGKREKGEDSKLQVEY